jgi:ferrochelatase
VADAARLVAAELGLAEHDVVWQSRSGPPQVPWLGPDIVEHLDTLAADGVPGRGRRTGRVRLRPRRGDLGPRHRGRERAEELGIAFARAATAGPDPRFADMVVELVAEHTAAAAPRGLSTDVPSAGCTVNGLPCAVDCCAPTRRPAEGRAFRHRDRRASPS